MKFGRLDFEPAAQHLSLVAEPTKAFIMSHPSDAVLVSASDSKVADTAAYCEAYDIGLDVCANCVIVEAKRADRTWYAACIVLATTRADVNGIVRRHLDARKISFAPMDVAVKLTGMEYGGITPIGLPVDWTILVDEQVTSTPYVIVGSGIRGSKILMPGKLVGDLTGASILGIAKD